MSTKPLVVFLANNTWSVAAVHRAVARELAAEFDFAYHSDASFYMQDVMRDYERAHTVVVAVYGVRQFLRFVPSSTWHKVLSIAHGTSEIPADLPREIRHAVVSDVCVPFYRGVPVMVTPNGVALQDYSVKQTYRPIGLVGWCGATRVGVKRIELAREIAMAAGVPLTIAETLAKEELRQWYQNIDVLVMTAGPEEFVESGPLPPFEAIASGTPVIGTRVGNFRKVPGPKFDTVEEAVAVLAELRAAGPAALQRLAEEQYAFVQANFDYAILAPAWKAAFLGVAGSDS